MDSGLHLLLTAEQLVLPPPAKIAMMKVMIILDILVKVLKFINYIKKLTKKCYVNQWRFFWGLNILTQDSQELSQRLVFNFLLLGVISTVKYVRLNCYCSYFIFFSSNVIVMPVPSIPIGLWILKALSNHLTPQREESQKVRIFFF